LVGGLEHLDFSHILGMSSSQLTLTPSFFRGVGQPPSRKIWMEMEEAGTEWGRMEDMEVWTV